MLRLIVIDKSCPIADSAKFKMWETTLFYQPEQTHNILNIYQIKMQKFIKPTALPRLFAFNCKQAFITREDNQEKLEVSSEDYLLLFWRRNSPDEQFSANNMKVTPYQNTVYCKRSYVTAKIKLIKRCLIDFKLK